MYVYIFNCSAYYGCKDGQHFPIWATHPLRNKLWKFTSPRIERCVMSLDGIEPVVTNKPMSCKEHYAVCVCLQCSVFRTTLRVIVLKVCTVFSAPEAHSPEQAMLDSFWWLAGLVSTVCTCLLLCHVHTIELITLPVLSYIGHFFTFPMTILHVINERLFLLFFISVFFIFFVQITAPN